MLCLFIEIVFSAILLGWLCTKFALFFPCTKTKQQTAKGETDYEMLNRA